MFKKCHPKMNFEINCLLTLRVCIMGDDPQLEVYGPTEAIFGKRFRRLYV
jgi:hypothetical protein